MEPHLIFINLVLKKFKYWYGGINFFNKKFCLNFENYEDNLKFNLILIKWISFSFRDPRFPSFFQKIFYSTWFYFVLKNKLSTYLNLKYCRKKKTISNLFKTVPNQKKKISNEQNTNFFKNFFFLHFKFKNFNSRSVLSKINYLSKISRIVNFKKITPNLNHGCDNIREKILKERFDFRKLETFSIDPLGTVETDDLIHYRFLKFGTFHEMGLHIPDIYSMLHWDDDFFGNLKEKNRSKFFLNRKFNLFPIFLSKNCFSFFQNIDRTSFSIIFLSDWFGKIKKIKLNRSLIRNKRLFSQVKISENLKKFKDSIQNKEGKCFYSKKLSIIENICLRLRSLRMKSKGNLDIFLKFETFFQHKKLNFMENLKEELIILSNVTLAEKVLEFFPNCTELRKTRYLKVDDFSKIFQFSKFLSINLDYSSFKKLIKNTQFLFNLKEKYVCEVQPKFRYYGKICKKETIFFCPSYGYKRLVEKINWGPLYVQMSSPIRRCDDNIIQKKLLNFF